MQARERLLRVLDRARRDERIHLDRDFRVETQHGIRAHFNLPVKVTHVFLDRLADAVLLVVVVLVGYGADLGVANVLPGGGNRIVADSRV